jgi:hypothetical protein
MIYLSDLTLHLANGPVGPFARAKARSLQVSFFNWLARRLGLPANARCGRLYSRRICECTGTLLIS